MEKLFGIPISQLTLAMLVIFGLVVVVGGIVALRNRVFFVMAARNIPRRRAQTALIILGLMLATLLFSAAFVTGDTITHSIRVLSLESLGEVDEIVSSQAEGSEGRFNYFEEDFYAQVETALADMSEVEGVTPIIREQAPVLAPATRLSEPRVAVLGFDPTLTSGFDPLLDADGQVLGIDALGENEVYISADTAEALEAAAGETVQLFFGSEAIEMTVAGIYDSGAYPAGATSLVLPLARLQALTAHAGEINSIVITNEGDLVDGAVHTDVVTNRLEPLLEGTDLEVEPVKEEALQQADLVGNGISTIFLLFGQFSIAAGIMLIFLIFVMLAAERKQELGIARAVGTQRGHIIRLFTFEGALYAIMAAAVGSVLGVVVGWAMVRVMALAFGGADVPFNLTYTFNWRSLVLAFTLGMFFTFVIVILSSWRVSRLNIVSAIRDIPESFVRRKSIKGWIAAILLPIIGLLLTAAGFQAEQTGVFMFGTSLVIIGLALLLWRIGLKERPVFTIAGLLLVIWWLLPESAVPFMADWAFGIELFFISGIMIVIGAVWTVVYNADLLLALSLLLFGRLKGMPPVLRAAMSYPNQNRFRTGMTLAMFSLVVFTLVVMAFIINSQVSALEDTDRMTGSFDIQANTNFNNPIPDLETALDDVPGVSSADFTAIGSVSNLPVKLSQEGTEQEPVDFFVQGANEEYTGAITYKFALRAEGYDSDEAVWRALQDEPNKAVVSPILVPSRTSFVIGGPEFGLEGFYMEDEELPDVYLALENPFTGAQDRFQVIGVLDQTSFFSAGPILTSQTSLNALAGQPMPAGTYLFQLRDGADTEAVAKALEAGFLENGMQTQVLAKLVEDNAQVSLTLNNLLQGFMSLGLVVGIAALGVITARAVVERRHHIGVLRAIGFQKEQVQLAFLLESSFVALLGILLGLVLGTAISYNVVNSLASDIEGIEFAVPWANLITVVLVAYLASLLTTYLSARSAANVNPADALRFE